MDENSLYWLLSTLPQVCAALVAFLGFLVLQSLDDVLRRRAHLYAQALDMFIRKSTDARVSEFRDKDDIVVSLMTQETFMATLSRALPDIPDSGWLKFYFDRWKLLDSDIMAARAQFSRFARLNVAVILVSLILLPFIPTLKKMEVLLWIAGAAGLAVSSAVVINAWRLIKSAVVEQRN